MIHWYHMSADQLFVTLHLSVLSIFIIRLCFVYFLFASIFDTNQYALCCLESAAK